MLNRHRGEIEATLDGRPYRLVLTLGALAELESAFGDDDMLALAARFEKGRLSAKDCTKIITAGLRWAGCGISEDDVNAMQAEGGAAGYVDIVARLLNATFGGGEARALPGGEGGGSIARDPFPGRA
jgi:hypothetical protein